MTLTFNVVKTRLLVLQTEAVKPATIIIQVHGHPLAYKLQLQKV